jgi:hypothetical protein
MRSVGSALIVIVALCVAGVAASADTVDSSTGSSTAAVVAQAAGQVDTAATAGATEAGADAPAADAADPSDGQVVATESDQPKKETIHIGVAYFAFMPTNGDTKRNFGRVWNGFGVGVFRPEAPSKLGFSWSLSVLSKNGESDALLVPMTVGVQRGFGGNPDRQSYAALRVGPYYGKVDDNLEGPDESKIGGCANVALGLIINRQFVLEARYDWFTRLAGNNFNGLTLTVGVKVAQYSR